MRDFRRLQNDPPSGVTGAPMDNNILAWQVGGFCFFGLLFSSRKETTSSCFRHHPARRLIFYGTFGVKEIIPPKTGWGVSARSRVSTCRQDYLPLVRDGLNSQHPRETRFPKPL